MGVEILFLILVLLMSVIIHEVSHGYMAHLLGDPTARHQGRLTLNPLPHLDLVGSILLPGVMLLSGVPFLVGWAKPVPYNPYNLSNQRWGELAVALVGPVVNIAIALVFGLALRFLLPHDVLSTAMVEIGALIVLINVLLAVFNMIPVPPLDGSKVLFAMLPRRYAYLRRVLEQNGFILIIILLFIIFSTNLLSILSFTVFDLIVGDVGVLQQALTIFQ